MRGRGTGGTGGTGAGSRPYPAQAGSGSPGSDPLQTNREISQVKQNTDDKAIERTGVFVTDTFSTLLCVT